MSDAEGWSLCFLRFRQDIGRMGRTRWGGSFGFALCTHLSQNPQELRPQRAWVLPRVSVFGLKLLFLEAVARAWAFTVGRGRVKRGRGSRGQLMSKDLWPRGLHPECPAAPGHPHSGLPEVPHPPAQTSCAQLLLVLASVCSLNHPTFNQHLIDHLPSARFFVCWGQNLLRYDLHIVNSSLFIVWGLTNFQRWCKHHHNQAIEYFHQYFLPAPLSSALPPPPSPWQPLIYFLSRYFCLFQNAL